MSSSQCKVKFTACLRTHLNHVLWKLIPKS